MVNLLERRVRGFLMGPRQGCGIRGFIPASTRESPPYKGVSLRGETLSVSQIRLFGCDT